ncbi:RAD59 [Candida oxycetoniae]|uniref:DNA repair and recombination protein RAD52 n=1 Tax=Candida oxycetoniae TaxID=497107 RepID=A0AAI9WYU7_9ASCO|nr:RAD59 [Candida oxycetoniae]KAI3405513.2 RAD59 [Candida oxycetoniae]
MVFQDCKYNVDEETKRLPSSVSYFPCIGDAEEFFRDGNDDEAIFNDDDEVPAIDDKTLSKISTLQAKLEQLQHLRDTRNYSGSSNKSFKFSRSVLYNLANEVFGFNGWSTELVSCCIQEIEEKTSDTVEQHFVVPPDQGEKENENEKEEDKEKESVSFKKRRFSARCVCMVRIILLDGTSTEGIGIGTATNLPHKYQCYIKCKKEAVTDAMKCAIIGLRDLYFDYESRRLCREIDF